MARKYSRDNRGRFAGGGGGATARGGRLRTAAGNKRKTQTMQSAAKPKGTVGKPKGLKPGAIAAKPAAKPTTRLKRTGQKVRIQDRMITNQEQGRRGIVSMSPLSKSVRKDSVQGRKMDKLNRIAERQSGITARRSINRGSNYNPDGTFNQSAANSNQRRTKQSKQLQNKLAFAASGKRIAFDAMKPRATAKPASAAAKPAAKPTTGAITAKPARAAAQPKSGRDIVNAKTRKIQNENLRHINAQIKDAGPNAAGLRLQKLQMQNNMIDTRPKPTAKQAAKSAQQTQVVRGRIAAMRQQSARVGRAEANVLRLADVRTNAAPMSRLSFAPRPSKKTIKSQNRADSALSFYRNPTKALREINKRKPGFRKPRGVR